MVFARLHSCSFATHTHVRLIPEIIVHANREIVARDVIFIRTRCNDRMLGAREGDRPREDHRGDDKLHESSSRLKFLNFQTCLV